MLYRRSAFLPRYKPLGSGFNQTNKMFSLTCYRHIRLQRRFFFQAYPSRGATHYKNHHDEYDDDDDINLFTK